MKIKVVTDGGASPNPGWMRIGVVLISDTNEVKKKVHRKLQKGTSNQAEVLALIEGVNQAIESGYSEVDAYTDSKLLYNHYNGAYRIKDHKLKELHKTLKFNIKNLKSFELSWHSREADTAQIADAASRGQVS